jgi:hypothetical protein
LVRDRETSRIVGAEASSLFACGNDLPALEGGLLCANDAAACIARGFHGRIIRIEGLGAFAECQEGCIIDCSGHLSTEWIENSCAAGIYFFARATRATHLRRGEPPCPQCGHVAMAGLPPRGNGFVPLAW